MYAPAIGANLCIGQIFRPRRLKPANGLQAIAIRRHYFVLI
jgi:hypothetical protein